MKIIASRKDDLIRERETYEAERERRRSQKHEEELLYRQAAENVGDMIRRRVTDRLGEVKLSKLDIEVRRRWQMSDDESWEVRVVGNSNHFDSEVALSWDWTVWISGEGEIKKESGSWSGLKATTPAQIEDLKESVRILELLNNMDWHLILKAPSPKYSDYIDSENSQALRKMNRNFDDEIKDAEIEELVGQPVLIKVNGLESQYYRGGGAYIQIVSQSDKFYTIKYLPDSYVTRFEPSEQHPTLVSLVDDLYTERKSRETVMRAIEYPIQTISLTEEGEV